MADGNTPPQQQQSSGAGTAAGETRKVYFCYQCNNTITEVLENFECPTCHSGFIEEREESVGADLFGIGGGSPGDDSTDFMNLLRGIIQVGSNLPQQQQGGQQQQDQGGRGRGRVNAYSSQDGSSLFISMNPGARVTIRTSGGGPEGGEQQTHQAGGGQANNHVGDVLHTFLNDLMTGLHGPGAQMTGGGGLPMMGNFQDYAWGANGLDAIVTQLMNQMEGSGPPPLSDDNLAKIENVQISQDLVDKKLQCSVCWDDFILNEEVKKLECEHVFHEGCIVPWLKLHGTCPICRKDLNTPVEGEEPREPPATAPAGSMFNMPLFPQQPQRTTQSNPTTPQLPQQQHSNNPNSNNPSSRSGITLGFGPFQIPIPNFSSTPRQQQQQQTQPSSNNSARNNSSSGGGRNQDHSNNSNSNRPGPNTNPNNRLDDLDDDFD